MVKKVILQVADTGPLESVVEMFESVGLQCYTPSDTLKVRLRQIGCDTVLDTSTLVRQWGYQEPRELPVACIRDMQSDETLYVDVKAHRSYRKIVNEWSNLEDRILWYRINGGKPEHVINERGDHGDEVNPPCPILTPNQWYKPDALRVSDRPYTPVSRNDRGKYERTPGGRKSYTFWPPFCRVGDYYKSHRRPFEESIATPPHRPYDNPICLIHRASQWGYGKLIDPLRRISLKIHGVGSPDGLIKNDVVASRLSQAKAMIHLKSSDAPGYAIYESAAAKCPLICSRRLIWRCKMQELLIPGETCLVFDRETHDPLTDEDVRECMTEIQGHLEALNDPEENLRLGHNLHEKLKSIMWSSENQNDVESFGRFISNNFED